MPWWLVIGDVLAHAALPGLCLAFLILGRRNLTSMLAGALVSGLIAVLLLTLLRSATRVKDDAVMGTIRSVFFGGGVVLISYIQNRSVEGSKAGLDSYILGSRRRHDRGRRATYRRSCAGVLLLHRAAL